MQELYAQQNNTATPFSDNFPRGRAKGHEAEQAEKEAEKEHEVEEEETRRRPSWRWRFACRSGGAWAGG